MSLESPKAIPAETQLSIEVKEFEFAGRATVTRCEPRGSRFRLGLLFDSAIPFFLDAKREAAECAEDEAAKEQARRSRFSLRSLFAGHRQSQ